LIAITKSYGKYIYTDYIEDIYNTQVVIINSIVHDILSVRMELVHRPGNQLLMLQPNNQEIIQQLWAVYTHNKITARTSRADPSSLAPRGAGNISQAKEPGREVPIDKQVGQTKPTPITESHSSQNVSSFSGKWNIVVRRRISSRRLMN